MSSDRYQKDTLKGDLEKIRSYYLDRGYLRFDIEANTVAVSPDKNSVYVTLQVKEGVQYNIKGIEFVGDLIGQDELIKAIDKVNELLQVSHSNNMDVQFATFLSNMKNHNGEDKKLVLKTTENIHVIPIYEVVSLSSDRNYTRFNFLERPPIIVSKTLKEFENILCEYGFMRVHRSHVINLKYIERFEKADGGYAVMRGGIKIEVSHRKKEDLLSFFDKL